MTKIDININRLMPYTRSIFNKDITNYCSLARNAIMKNDGVGKRNGFKLLKDVSELEKDTSITNLDDVVFDKGICPIDDRLVINIDKDVIFLSKYGVKRLSSVDSSEDITLLKSEVPTWLFDMMERFRLLDNRRAEVFYCKEQNFFGFRLSGMCFIAQEIEKGEFTYSIFDGDFTESYDEMFMSVKGDIIIKDGARTYKYDLDTFDNCDFRICTMWMTPSSNNKQWVNEIFEIKTKNKSMISVRSSTNYDSGKYWLSETMERRSRSHSIFKTIRYDFRTLSNSDFYLTGLIFEGEESK